jgi:signal transduction histidine kinase
LASARASGLTVRIEQKGARRPLPTRVDQAAYRIVQEALTNSARYSNGTRALVRIVYGDRDVEIEVDDEGDGRHAQPVAGAGQGIVGMRERAQALGGSLRAGPRPEGGFFVSARLPYRAETA